MNKKEMALKWAKEHDIKFVQFWFSDIRGNLKRKTRLVEDLESDLEDGVWFDGSSIEGFVRTRESDMRLIPDPRTLDVVPWSPEEYKNAKMFCDVIWPDGRPFEGDPRFILKRAIKKAKRMGFIYNAAPEVEFFLLKNDGSPIDQAGYFDATGDLGEGFRQQVLLNLKKIGIRGETGHHEVARGQQEIDIKYDEALTTGDNTITLKHVIQRTAQHQGLQVTFIPKLFPEENGSGMHIHQSLFDKNGRNLFYDTRDRYRLSVIAYYFIAGQLTHAKALAAITSPTITSYKRLVAGYEAPVYICWGQGNREPLIRVPQFTPGREKSIRCELRCPDPLCNPYLALAIMLTAGLDGIKKKLPVPYPVKDEELNKSNVEVLPSSLEKALDALEKDGILLKALGPHTAQKFLEAKRKEWEKYCKKEPEENRKKITDWELKHYL